MRLCGLYIIGFPRYLCINPPFSTKFISHTTLYHPYLYLYSHHLPPFFEVYPRFSDKFCESYRSLPNISAIFPTKKETYILCFNLFIWCSVVFRTPAITWSESFLSFLRKLYTSCRIVYTFCLCPLQSLSHSVAIY